MEERKMESRKLVLDAVNHKEPRRVPIYGYTFYAPIADTPEETAIEHWLKAFNIEKSNSNAEDDINIQLKLGADAIRADLGFNRNEAYSNRWRSFANQIESDIDENKKQNFEPPLANASSVNEIENYNWPVASKIIDFSLLDTLLNKIGDHKARVATIGWEPIFCTPVLQDLFGTEELMIKMYVEPSLVEAAIKKIEDYNVEANNLLIKYAKGRADFIKWGDDFAGQRGLIISPEFWRRYLKPSYRKIFQIIKDNGLKVWFHSCGSFREIMPDLIDIGMDVWETVQAHLPGNEPLELKKRIRQLYYFCRRNKYSKDFDIWNS